MTPQIEQEIREILEKLWIDCNNIPDDGTIYDPIGVLQDRATEKLLSLISQHYVAKSELQLYEEYIKLLKDELDEVCPIAYTHGWRSNRYEQGKKLRDAIHKRIREGR